jgi:hypothetical protein
MLIFLRYRGEGKCCQRMNDAAYAKNTKRLSDWNHYIAMPLCSALNAGPSVVKSDDFHTSQEIVNTSDGLFLWGLNSLI